MAGAVTILVATPLVGLTFGLPGDGRIGFLALGALWAAALVWLPTFERPAASAPAPRAGGAQPAVGD